MINWFNAVIFDVKSKNSTITSTLVFWHRLCYRIVQEWFAMRRSTPLSNILCAHLPTSTFQLWRYNPTEVKSSFLLHARPEATNYCPPIILTAYISRRHVGAYYPELSYGGTGHIVTRGSLVLKGLIGCSLANHKNTTKIYPCNNPWWQYLWPVPSV
jgi:hypothetical protein